MLRVEQEKHKFTCLNDTCLKHSWVCQNHADENQPLIAAHQQELSLQNQQTPTSEPAAQSLAARPRSGKTKTKKGRTLGTDTRKRKARPHLSAFIKADLSPTSTSTPSDENPRTWHVTCKHKTSCSFFQLWADHYPNLHLHITLINLFFPHHRACRTKFIKFRLISPPTSRLFIT